MRFPEFSGEWERKTLGEVIKLQGGYAFKSEDFQDSGIPIVRISNLPQDDDSVSLADCVYYEQGSYENYEIHFGDLLIAMSGATTGKTAIYRDQAKAYLNQRVGRFKPIAEIHYPLLYSIVNSPAFRNQLNSKLIAGAQPNISSSDIESIKCYIPHIDEQIKIATLMQEIDKRIAIQNKIIERYQSLIRALAHTLIGGDYPKIKLADIAEIYQPKTISLNELSAEGLYPVYGANGIIGYYDKCNHDSPQICVACRGSSCGTVNFTQPYSWITGNAMVVNPDKYPDVVNKRYLYYALTTHDFTNIISGSGQPQIVRTPMLSLDVPLPSLAKQIEIATIIDTFEKASVIEMKRLALYQSQNKILLSLLFI